MNRADAIDLDSQSKKKECTNCLGRNIGQLEFEARQGKRVTEDLRGKDFQVKKGLFLIDVMRTAYQCGESKVVSEASKKLLDTIKEL